MPAVVRYARPEDAAAIADLALKLFAQHRDYDAERFAELSDVGGAERYYRSRIAAAEGVVFVAETENGLAGFAYLEYERLDYAQLLENAAWLHDLYVDVTARGSGAGKALMEAAIEAGRGFGADKLVLTTAAKNAYARSFFARAGFRETMVEMTIGLND